MVKWGNGNKYSFSSKLSPPPLSHLCQRKKERTRKGVEEEGKITVLKVSLMRQIKENICKNYLMLKFFSSHFEYKKFFAVILKTHQ